jgi:hypothetical protein
MDAWDVEPLPNDPLELQYSANPEKLLDGRIEYY